MDFYFVKSAVMSTTMTIVAVQYNYRDVILNRIFSVQ